MTAHTPIEPVAPVSGTSPLSGRWRWTHRVAAGALLIWGAMHVAGGGILIASSGREGGRAGLELLGSNAPPTAFPVDAGPVTAAVLGFHGLNLLLAGAAVVALTAVVVRKAWPRGVTAAFGVIAAADVGLVTFLLAPGHMSALDGVWGPLLFIVALAAAWAGGWRPRQL